ncbi:hypothetical protein FRC11_003755 [Ceratobasidium sp. 423]|nr:hypothetical protein FRC11_003755 [Ceratobasidium sp. 423]
MRAHVGRVGACKQAERAAWRQDTREKLHPRQRKLEAQRVSNHYMRLKQPQAEIKHKVHYFRGTTANAPVEIDADATYISSDEEAQYATDNNFDDKSIVSAEDGDIEISDTESEPESAIEVPIASESDGEEHSSVDRESTGSPRVNQVPRTYSFAVVEEHPRVVLVLRWEVVNDDDEDAGRGNPPLLWQGDVFLLAEWLANMKCTNRDRERYFAFKMHERNLPWDNLGEMYVTIDTFTFTPGWTHEILEVRADGGLEILDVYMRNILAVIKYLIGLRRLRDHIRYSSERHWTFDRQGHRARVYDEMWSGEWWWRIQVNMSCILRNPGVHAYNNQFLIPFGGVAVPVLVATDPTQLTTHSGDKVACPVYATIRNISKDIRAKPREHAWVLIGYLPVPSLAFIENEAHHREKKWEVYHAAMTMILEPLKQAGETGIEARCADGGVRQLYPILAVKITDWPERCTGACTQATRCPACTIAFRNRGSLVVAPLRTKQQTLETLLDSRDGYDADRKELGLRPTWPYWAELPFANGADATVPDPLHQVHKGLFKTHLLEWWKKMIGQVALDNRYKALPRTHCVRHFTSGPCTIGQLK